MATDIVARGMAGSKLDKSGGIIDGNLAITGDLNVNGTTVTTRQETLFIKDNMIVTNADGLGLQGASGIAIRSGSSVVYGLVYEPTSDTVMFGLGSLDNNNNFTFNSGEGLPIAIRADSSSFVDGHFVKWDATNYCFVDGGSVADIPNQKPFRESWTTTSFTALIADVYADTTVVAGDVYIGVVSGGVAGGMPFNGNAEVRIEVNTANRVVLHCEVTSSNVAPYHWECQVVSGVINPWRSWVLTKPDGTNDLISNNKINNTYLDMDSTPTENSTNPVQSGGVYTDLSNKLGTSGNGSSTTVTFTDAQTRTNVATGETQATLWGKVKKWFTDLGTAAFKNVPASGNASTTEVVMGDDTRLTNARNAADVYSWAKAENKPTYSYSEITNTPTIGNGRITIKKNDASVGYFVANQSSDSSVNITDGDLFDNLVFGTEGIYWNMWSGTEAMDNFLSTLSAESEITSFDASCLIKLVGEIGIYSVGLAQFGGTGYAVAIVDESTFVPSQLLYVSEDTATNREILETPVAQGGFGLTVNNAGWQTNLSGHMYIGSNMRIADYGVMPSNRTEMYRINAFFGTAPYRWQMLYALFGTVIGDVSTVLDTLNSGTGV